MLSNHVNMKRKTSSPVLGSLKCSVLRKGNDILSASSNSTQESKFSTQNTPSFRTRLEKKFQEHPDSQGLIDHETRSSEFDISLETCSPSNVDVGPFFGLPTKVQELIFKYRKIKGLYEWQEKCLKSALTGENLLISLPTSSGKTLVAEILMLRKLLLHRKDALFILPYVSLVQEKVRGLCSLGVDFSFIVDEYAANKGLYPPKKRRRRNTIYIATIEKANSLIESMLEANRISEIGLVVIDEIHMITETGGRGAKLESTIIKLKHFTTNIQLVAMSATVGNLKELARFLDAQLFKGEFRPVPLTQYLKVEDKIAVINSNPSSNEDLLEPSAMKFYHSEKKFSKVDSDMIAPLLEEIIPQHSCLIFCRSKNNVQAVASMLSTVLSKKLMEYQRIAKKSLLAALKEESNGILCNILRRTVPFGIGYHHSGLTDGERKLLEEAFIIGTLCCIVCTSTLAAGVNLPARRVIIRSPYIANMFLTKARYHQMIGRAGRAGLDSMGESFLIVDPKDLSKARELLLSPHDYCISRLSENGFKGLRELLFSMIGLKMVKSISSAIDLSDQSLLALQAQMMGINLHSEVLNVLEDLRSQGFLKSHKDSVEENKENFEVEKVIVKESFEKNDKLIVCRIGKAAVKGSLDLLWANQLYSDLLRARQYLVVHSHLHLLYLVTPYESSDSFVCKPETFCRIYFNLPKEDSEVANLLGITNARAIKISMGSYPKDLDRKVLSRFTVALLLHKIMSGTNIWEVSDMFQVHRGLVQQLFNSTVSFAHNVLYFCEDLEELWAFRDLLMSFTKTLSICSAPEVTPLMALPAVKLGRAKLLYRAGFKTVTDIAKSNPQQLVTSVDHVSYSVARQIISSAKMLLMEKVNALQEEAEGMMLDLIP